LSIISLVIFQRMPCLSLIKTSCTRRLRQHSNT
jgi:hypothetical protein